MKIARSKYQVHAEVLSAEHPADEFDDAQAGYPLARRLNRIERVAASYRGQVDLRFNNVLLISFDTADAALLGACEMQHRCAILPQSSRQRVVLRIGVHQSLVRQRSKDSADGAQEIASRLAIADDSILVSESVVEALNPDLCKLTRPLERSPVEMAAYSVDWRGEIPSAAYGGESFWPTSMGAPPVSPYLLLHYGLKSLELTQDNPVITVGRDPLCDLVLAGIHISRNHCRIERRSDAIVLTGTSTNGTCVVTDNGVKILVKKDSAVLEGKGLLFFGRPFNGERRGGVRFESY